MAQLLLVKFQVILLVHLILSDSLLLGLHLEEELLFPFVLVVYDSVVLSLLGHLGLTLLLLLLDLELLLLSLALFKVHLGMELLLLLALDLVVDLVLDIFPVSSSEVRLQVQTALTSFLPWD